jgi:hypothetical protein
MVAYVVSRQRKEAVKAQGRETDDWARDLAEVG